MRCEKRKMTLAKINSLKDNYDATRAVYKVAPVDSMAQYMNEDNWVRATPCFFTARYRIFSPLMV